MLSLTMFFILLQDTPILPLLPALQVIIVPSFGFGFPSASSPFSHPRACTASLDPVPGSMQSQAGYQPQSLMRLSSAYT